MAETLGTRQENLKIENGVRYELNCLGMNKPSPDHSPQTTTRPPYYRATFSLPAHLATDISRLAKRMGVSQSAMLSELLQDPIAAMCAIIDSLPQAAATKDDVRRAKGKGLEYIRKAMAEAQQLVDDEGQP